VRSQRSEGVGEVASIAFQSHVLPGVIALSFPRKRVLVEEESEMTLKGEGGGRERS
jgi:hypothetical protein